MNFGSMRDQVKKTTLDQESNRQAKGSYYDFSEYQTKPDFYKPEEGTVLLDVIPYIVSQDIKHPEVNGGSLWYRRRIRVHYNIGADNRSYLCPQTIGKKCPICEYIQNALKKDKDAWHDPEIEQIRAKEREIYNVIDLVDKKAGIKLMEISYHLFGKKLEEEIVNGPIECSGFADFVDGRTLKVRFIKGKFKGNPFTEASRFDFEQRPDYNPEILKKVYNLDKILKVLSYETLERLFLDGSDTTPDGGLEDEDIKTISVNDIKNISVTSPVTSPVISTDIPSVKEDDKIECPDGGTFGSDFDSRPGCKNCDSWLACADSV